MPRPTKELQREYQREWMAKRRAAWFADKSCVVCGSRDNLQLDHIDPTTKVTHAVWSWKEERRETELVKCQTLCEQHHREKTSKENGIKFTKPLVHGTIAGYKKDCRCKLCHEALLIYWKERRAKNKTFQG